MHIRRVVTAKTARGKSEVVYDGESPRTFALKHTPGFVSSLLWSTRSPPAASRDRSDAAVEVNSLLPGPGETRFSVVTFPPDSVTRSPDFDPARAAAEFQAAVPGIAETFEADHPGMHATPTVDYAIVLDGEIWLELDDGAVIHLRSRDTIVQNGTRHAWRNPGERSATVAFVMIGY